MMGNNVFVSESVAAGHPDKLCDRISDAIVDRFLAQDALARVDVECAIATGIVFIASYYAANVAPDVVDIARRVIAASGYSGREFNARDCTVMTTLRERSDMARSPGDEEELPEAELDRLTANDPVTVFGFACAESKTLMPLPIHLAHNLTRALDSARESEKLPWLHPDGSVQVAVRYRDGSPDSIHSLTLNPSLTVESMDQGSLRSGLMDAVVGPAFEGESLQPNKQTRILITPPNLVSRGGPSSHAGLTGRKTAIDAYGQYTRTSGSALSGKDPLRTDRIAVYGARWAAKNLVAAGLARFCEVLLSYELGRAKPISVQVRSFGSSRLDDAQLTRRVKQLFDFRPGALMRAFGLRKRISTAERGYLQHLAAYGHVGREDLDLPWERRDRIDELVA
jgi:S-adenosylmethionine synthetase